MIRKYLPILVINISVLLCSIDGSASSYFLNIIGDSSHIYGLGELNLNSTVLLGTDSNFTGARVEVGKEYPGGYFAGFGFGQSRGVIYENYIPTSTSMSSAGGLAFKRWKLGKVGFDFGLKAEGNALNIKDQNTSIFSSTAGVFGALNIQIIDGFTIFARSTYFSRREFEMTTYSAGIGFYF